ncbi:MAG: hypothetical protein AMS15_09845 [Planctomycetes bacterium DG_23]|nr:MAG: hypothetical protein AMS15_09845 [Planctomycetes bacterium DG_23]
MKKREQKISRREFVKRLAGGTAIGAAGMGALLSGLGPSLFVSESLAQEKGLKYRPLGKTGLKVSEISFGGIYIAEAAVLAAAIDKGVNLIHTSYKYQRGDGLRMFGDMVLTPIHDLRRVNRPELPELYARLKEKKKVRFFGLACHSNMAAVMQAAIKRGIFDVMLVRYDLSHRASLDPLVAEAKKAGMGFMAMKTVKEYREGSYKDTLKKLLENKDVDALLVGMKDIQEVEEDLSASSG